MKTPASGWGVGLPLGAGCPYFDDDAENYDNCCINDKLYLFHFYPLAAWARSKKGRQGELSA